MTKIYEICEICGYFFLSAFVTLWFVVIIEGMETKVQKIFSADASSESNQPLFIANVPAAATVRSTVKKKSSTAGGPTYQAGLLRYL